MLKIKYTWYIVLILGNFMYRFVDVACELCEMFDISGFTVCESS